MPHFCPGSVFGAVGLSCEGCVAAPQEPHEVRARHSWELWNEPDNRDYWTGSAEAYAALLREGSLGVRAGDSSAAVVLGGIATNLRFLKSLFVEHHVAPLLDAVNLHSYTETWSADSIESIASYVTEAHSIVRDHGENEPLWMAEIGYSSYREGTHVSDAYQAT